MMPPPSDRLAGPSALAPAGQFVGRDEERKALLGAVDALRRGRGRTFFISGDPGVGKTRLVKEAVAVASARDYAVLWGTAYPMEDGLAYGIVVEALSGYLRTLSPEQRSSLLDSIPELGGLLGGGARPSRLVIQDPALARTRLLDGISRLLEGITARRRLVLIFDDLHLADANSRETVHFLARRLADYPVLMLATYRVAAEAKVLLPLIRSLRRLNLVSELQLKPFTPDAVRNLVIAILGSEPPQSLLDLLDARAAGVPLFVETILRELLQSGQLIKAESAWALSSQAVEVLPAQVRDLVLERLDRLGTRERQIMNLLAVGGEPLTAEVLTQASGLASDLLEAVQELRTHGLVAEQAGAAIRFSITHPLIQETAYRELTEMARRRIHAALINVIELSGSSEVDRLARHYRGARGLVAPERAVEVLMKAGERARDLHANYEAAQHFEAALELCSAGPAQDRCAFILERLGDLHDRMGDTASAIALLNEARQCYAEAGDAEGDARICTALAVTRSDHGHFDEALRDIDDGLAALVRHGPSQQAADLWNAKLVIHGRLGDFAGAATISRKLLALSRALGSQKAVAEAHLAAAAVQFGQPSYSVVRRSLVKALEAAANCDEHLLVLRARHLLALIALTLGEHREAATHAEFALGLARQLSSPVLELNPMASAAEADYLAGRWPEALEGTAAAVALARRLDRPRVVAWMLATRTAILALMGDLSAARACLASAREAFGGSTADRNIFVQVDVAEAILALEEGYQHGAASLASSLGVDPSTLLPLRLALATEAAFRAGRKQDVLVFVSRLNEIDGGLYPRALASRLLGLLAKANHDRHRAIVEMRSAANAFQAMQIPFEEARARYELGCLLSGERAAGELSRSLELFRSLGARRYLERARRPLAEMGVRIRRSPEASGARLTAREREVAALVAQGLSNGQIAARLILSQRTVTTHLSHIYERTGIKERTSSNSRTALTRYVLESGLGARAPAYVGPKSENT